MEKAISDIDAHRPLHVHGSPPCTPWTIMQNINQRTEEQCARLAKQRRWGRKVILNVLKVLRHALAKGCQVSFEHPVAASSWRMIPELFDFWTQLYERVTYGCAWGFRDSETGALLKKGWRIVFSDQDCARRLLRKCSGDHEHKVIEG